MWLQAVACGVGIWLMAAPEILGYAGSAATNDRVVGPLAASIAGVALWQVARGLRWANVALGAWLLLAPAVLDHEGRELLNSELSGVILAGASIVPAKGRYHYGGGWRSLLKRTRSGDDSGRASS